MASRNSILQVLIGIQDTHKITYHTIVSISDMQAVALDTLKDIQLQLLTVTVTSMSTPITMMSVLTTGTITLGGLSNLMDRIPLYMLPITLTSREVTSDNLNHGPDSLMDMSVSMSGTLVKVRSI